MLPSFITTFLKPKLEETSSVFVITLYSYKLGLSGDHRTGATTSNSNLAKPLFVFSLFSSPLNKTETVSLSLFILKITFPLEKSLFKVGITSIS